ncbi:MAG: Trm112 family protein [Gammaproteobacteria bacterium]|nr:Trm112 family protein [Gammaproteobacteria bacterium]
MALDKKFLEILVCPVTKAPLKELSADRLATLNRLIAQGDIDYRDGTPVKEPLSAALITADGRTVYRIDDDIPILLEDSGIAAHQVPGW